MMTVLKAASRESLQGAIVDPRKKNTQAEGITPTTKRRNISCKNDINGAEEKKPTRGHTESRNQGPIPSSLKRRAINPSVLVTSAMLLEKLEALDEEYPIGLNGMAEINDKLQLISIASDQRDGKQPEGGNECASKATENENLDMTVRSKSPVIRVDNHQAQSHAEV
ncbi:hypothetical protein SNEBB_001099, partial [Seison nebaliae]